MTLQKAKRYSSTPAFISSYYKTNEAVTAPRLGKTFFFTRIEDELTRNLSLDNSMVKYGYFA